MLQEAESPGRGGCQQFLQEAREAECEGPSSTSATVTLA